jgi:hypothetical protein
MSTKYFDKVEPGQFFFWKKNIFLRIENIALIGPKDELPRCGAGSRANCASVETGALRCVEDDELVILCPNYGASPV